MTFSEMRAEAELLYESIDSSNAPGFLDAEWGQFFTIAQRKIVIKILSEGITKNAINQLAIEKLIIKDSYADFVANTHYRNSDGTFAWQLDRTHATVDPRFFWILDEYVDTATHSNIPLDRITYDFYRSNLDNPFRKPDPVEGYWVLQFITTGPDTAVSSEPVFITDGSEITGYYIVGASHPDDYPIGPGIVYDTASGEEASVLNQSIHSRIVEEAVTLARMSVVDAQGYQLALAEFAK